MCEQNRSLLERHPSTLKLQRIRHWQFHCVTFKVPLSSCWPFWRLSAYLESFSEADLIVYFSINSATTQLDEMHLELSGIVEHTFICTFWASCTYFLGSLAFSTIFCLVKRAYLSDYLKIISRSKFKIIRYSNNGKTFIQPLFILATKSFKLLK